MQKQDVEECLAMMASTNLHVDEFPEEGLAFKILPTEIQVLPYELYDLQNIHMSFTVFSI